jgi:methylated-DNA-[protein]-cysteine S-methyltransferase
MILTCTIETPLGAATVSAENEALTGLWFVGQKYYPSKSNTWIYKPDYPVFELLRNWLFDYFSGKNNILNFRLDPKGTLFKKAVWDILLEIPYGQI